jgi:hypothetical protein
MLAPVARGEGRDGGWMRQPASGKENTRKDGGSPTFFEEKKMERKDGNRTLAARASRGAGAGAGEERLKPHAGAAFEA